MTERQAYWRRSVRNCVLGAAGGGAVLYFLGGDFSLSGFFAIIAGAVGALIADFRALEKHGPDRSKHPRGWLYHRANRLWHFGWRITQRRRSRVDA